MLNAIQSGIFNKSAKQRLDELEQTKSGIEVKILQEEIQKPLMTREQLTFFLHKFQDLERMEILKTMQGTIKKQFD